MTNLATLAVVLENVGRHRPIPSKKKFQAWINQVFLYVKKTIPKHIAEIHIGIINQKTSAQLNKKYRKKNRPTNVLAFTYRAYPGEKITSLGDLAICADIVKQEAKSQKKSIESHWAHLTIHGTLHLLGYDHHYHRDAKKMELLEIKILKKLGFQNPYLP